MVYHHQHGNVKAIINRKIITVGNSRCISLTQFLEGVTDVQIIVLINDVNRIDLIINKNPTAKIIKQLNKRGGGRKK